MIGGCGGGGNQAAELSGLGGLQVGRGSWEGKQGGWAGEGGQ